MRSRLLQGRWEFLFTALILQMVFNPCMRTSYGEAAPWYAVVFNSLVILTIIHKLSDHWAHLVGGLLLGLPSLVLIWIPGREALDVILVAFLGVLYLFAIAMLIPKLLKMRDVGISELFGAGSLYILFGLAWALLYRFLEYTIPGSFQLNIGLTPDLGDFIYYSFVTLTTLGYGDIVPISCQARSLAILEAISGLLTLSLIVARLISLNAAKIMKEDQPL